MIKLWIYKQIFHQLAEKEAFFCTAMAKKHQVFVVLDGLLVFVVLQQTRKKFYGLFLFRLYY
jgi:hypothetical protein